MFYFRYCHACHVSFQILLHLSCFILAIATLVMTHFRYCYTCHVSFQILPHLSWPMMFYLFGFMGITWVLAWVVLYQEARTSTDEEFIEPPKVSVLCII